MGTQSTWGSVVNMDPRHMLSATLLLAVAQASSLRPASTVALESFDRLMELSRDERTLYSGFKPPMLQRSYDEDYDVVASTRSLGCPMKWTTRGDFCYRHFSASTGGWTWDQARRECKSEAYSEGQMGADLTFPQNEEDNNFVKGLVGSEDVWLGAKFPVNQLQKKTSTGNPETWGDYNGWSSWKDGITPARGISSERRLLIKGDSSGDWVVWNGNEKKGFVCQYRKKACKTGWFEDTTLNKCLKAFTGEDNKMTWQNAQRKCEEQGLNGNLASLMSEANVLSLLGAQPVPTPATTPEPHLAPFKLHQDPAIQQQLQPTRPSGWEDLCSIMAVAWTLHGLMEHLNGTERKPIMSIRMHGLQVTTNPPLGLEKSTHSSIMMEKLGSTLEMTKPTSFASMISH